MLEFKNITKRYGDYTALENISLTIAENKTTVLIGPSGCGKSTLLRLMLGLIQADKGVIQWQGKPLLVDRYQQIRKQTGYVIQDGGLFPHLSVADNISIMAKYFAWPKHETKQRLNELCELTTFPVNLLDQFPNEISGGQRQRVSLMRALMLNPDLLLLDEPLGALDPLIRFDMQADLKSIFQELRKTVLLVTHDLAEAEFFADEIILINEGQIEQQGLMNEFIDSPQSEFVSRFVKAQRKIGIQ